ncbi:MAG: hypothetical protein BZ136_08730, partial [Methanosphaera sp. rholeuAM74]
MDNKKLKRIFLLFIMLILFIGVACAGDVSDASSTSDDTVDDSTSHTNTEKVGKKYDVTNYDTLHAALTNDDYNNVTVNIKSNIALKGNTTISESIETLTINGNKKTVNGNGTSQFIKISGENIITINSLTIINCNSTYGSAIEKNNGTLTINNCAFINNAAKYGGAIDNYKGDLNIIQSNFTSNKANENGGAIRNYGETLIKSSSFSNNRAEYDGGAIYNEEGDLTIQDCDFNSNYADDDGGAIYHDEDILSVEACQFKNNSAYDDGNTIYADYSTKITNSRIYDSSDELDESVYRSGTVNIINTIINGENINKTDNTRIAIKASNSTPTVDDEVTITATLTDLSNKKLANQNITLRINGREYNLKSNANGTVSQKYRITMGGLQNITAHYIGTDSYNKSSAKLQINAKKSSTKLTLKLSQTRAEVNEEVTINATLVNQKNMAIAGKDITFTISGKNYTAKTNANGTATLKHKPTALGTNKITAKYVGDNTTYTSSQATANLNVTGRYDTKIMIQASTIAPLANTRITIKATLLDQNDNKLYNRYVNIKVDGDSYTTKTNDDGIAAISYNMTNVGVNTITAKYGGSQYYTPSNATAKITTRAKSGTNSKVDTRIVLRVSDTSPPLNRPVTITATLTDQNNNKLTSQNITLTIDGGKHVIKGDNNAMATYNYTPRTAKNMTITAKYGGNSIF